MNDSFGDGKVYVGAPINGRLVDFDAAVNLMDDELREHIYSTIVSPCTNQQFIDAYTMAHAAKFGEVFKVM